MKEPMKYILSIDPSGAFKEGKGTTGWCLFSATCDRILLVGEISAKDYKTPMDYWQAHKKLILDTQEYLDITYKAYYLRVVIEDYLLYAHKANSQINSRMETSQLLGILKTALYEEGLPYRTRPAGQVLKRWSNKILLRKEYINKYKNRICFLKTPLNGHILDSIRHAVHESTFYMDKPCENEEEKNELRKNS